MVSFTSISQGIVLISIMMLGSSDAAPVAGNKTNSTANVAPHTNATVVDSFTLPPIIASRTKPVFHPEFTGNLDAEAKSIEKNKKWFIEHGGNYNNITKRGDDSSTDSVGGMTMDLPTPVPPLPSTANVASVVTATNVQINEYTSFAGIASTGYCRSVVPAGKWDCKNCLKYVPDGKLLVTFTALLSDTHGFVLRSDAQKVIHLVFRGTNSIRNAITVSMSATVIYMQNGFTDSFCCFRI
jgi:hypothetical protein